MFDLLQADVETLRDELEFKNHKIEEFESMLQAERQRLKDMGQELQVQKQQVRVRQFFAVFFLNSTGVHTINSEYERKGIGFKVGDDNTAIIIKNKS